MSSPTAETLEQCCAARAWVSGMVEKLPLDATNVEQAARDVAATLTRDDWLEAFSAHPRIGDVSTLRAKFANTKRIAANEQAGVNSADDGTIEELARLNDAYFEKFGYIFIVCATGKSAAEMLSILQTRLPNDPADELPVAAAEQLEITLLRLQKLTHPE